MVEKQNEQKMEGISTEFLQETMVHMVKVLGEPAKEYKDRVFRMLLKDRNVALESNIASIYDFCGYCSEISGANEV